MSTSGGAWRALQRGREINCESVQIFVKNNFRWFGNLPPPQKLALFAAELSCNGFSCVFGHTNYLINLGAAASENRDRSIQSLIQEMEFSNQLKLPFLVMHPGAHLGAGEEQGIQRIVEGLNEVFAATKTMPVRIALENTAGQGTCLGYQMKHFAEIYDRINTPERLCVCLDTAHLFAGGYDIRTRKGWERPLGEIESSIGLEQIVAFHLNDSKTALGSRVDRHEHIGRGQIGLEGFRALVTDTRFKNHPGCLETPKSEDMHEDVENLATLRSLESKAGKKVKRKKLIR
jgi:deoxyribonuclease IV